MAQDLKGKRALVTGAASGIGQAIAVAFARAGARVAVQARTEARLKATLAKIAKAGGKAIPVAADLGQRGQIKAMCKSALKGLGGIDIVVNNAGVCKLAPMWKTPDADWDETLAVNLTAPFLISKELIPVMLKQNKGGRMIYIASISGKEAEAESTAYNASKAGLILFGQCLAREVGPKGITVNSICPGWIETKMAHEVIASVAPKGEPFKRFYETMMTTNMMHARQGPDDIAEMALFLAGPGGKHVTGQAINVCAGMSTK